MITRQSGYHVTQFRATHSTTQGGLVSPTLFNVDFNSVVQTWLLIRVEDDVVVHDRLRNTVGQIMSVIYADDEILGFMEPE